VEIHDARPQQESAAHHGVRHEYLAAALQTIEQLTVQRIQVALGRLDADVRAKIARHVAEGGNAQILGREFEIVASAIVRARAMSPAIISRYPAAPTCFNASQTFSARNPREFWGP